MIPYTLFYELLGAIRHASAAEQLQAYYSTLLAVAQVWSDEKGKATVTTAVRRLSALAYPAPEDPK